MRWLWCKLTDCEYDMESRGAPFCRRCGSEDYWPIRRTIGRLIEDVKAAWSQWRLRHDNTDMPF